MSRAGREGKSPVRWESRVLGGRLPKIKVGGREENKKDTLGLSTSTCMEKELKGAYEADEVQKRNGRRKGLESVKAHCRIKRIWGTVKQRHEGDEKGEKGALINLAV